MYYNICILFSKKNQTQFKRIPHKEIKILSTYKTSLGHVHLVHSVLLHPKLPSISIWCLWPLLHLFLFDGFVIRRHFLSELVQVQWPLVTWALDGLGSPSLFLFTDIILFRWTKCNFLNFLIFKNYFVYHLLIEGLKNNPTLIYLSTFWVSLKILSCLYIYFLLK